MDEATPGADPAGSKTGAPAPERLGGFSAAMTIVLVYILLAPGLAALLINAYEVGVNGQSFSVGAIVAFYLYGWVFVMFAAVPHALTRHWPALWTYLASIPLPLMMVSMLEWKLGVYALIALSACFGLARWLDQRL